MNWKTKRGEVEHSTKEASIQIKTMLLTEEKNFMEK